MKRKEKQMKKISLLLAMMLGLTACESGTGTAVGRTLAKTWIDAQCHTELDNRSEWQLITMLMSKETKTEWENKICGCASEEAANQLTAAELADMLTTEGRVKVLANVTGKTVTACVKRLYTDAVK